ncbi:MAG: DUF4115 domain-containing protein [Colwellia sp.]|nr:DUF4115 domain-containing protein [Colwellia sp.]
MSNKEDSLDVTGLNESNQQSDLPGATELDEDMEVIGPGQMLSQARESLGLTQEDIVDKLNFRLLLVKNIEADIIDPNLPETFNRGYLCGYAKLVGISNEDILNSYETLNIAKIQCAELQSFSRNTQKEAQNSLLTWISYLIVAILIGSTVMWYLQDSRNVDISANQPVTPAADVLVEKVKTADLSEASSDVPTLELSDNEVLQPKQNRSTEVITLVENKIDELITDVEHAPDIATAIFTFSGDCWVSIYDATGERIAYGVKKTGYVMTITGQAPFKVDIGRPALTSIEFNGEVIDMSKFDKDNIAKFTLPISEE